MTSEHFQKCVAELNEAAGAIVKAKRPGYTLGNADVLANFKSAAERARITPQQAWVVLMNKGMEAIFALMSRPELPLGESALSRFADAKNYLDLGWAIFEETQNATRANAVTIVESPKAQEALRQFAPRAGYLEGR